MSEYYYWWQEEYPLIILLSLITQTLIAYGLTHGWLNHRLNTVALDLVCDQHLTRATRWWKNGDHISFHSWNMGVRLKIRFCGDAYIQTYITLCACAVSRRYSRSTMHHACMTYVSTRHDLMGVANLCFADSALYFNEHQEENDRSWLNGLTGGHRRKQK